MEQEECLLISTEISLDLSKTNTGVKVEDNGLYLFYFYSYIYENISYICHI